MRSLRGLMIVAILFCFLALQVAHGAGFALYEGENNRSGNLSTPLTNVLADYEVAIGDTEAATITSYENLEIRWWGVAISGATTFHVDNIGLSVPDVSGPETGSFTAGAWIAGLYHADTISNADLKGYWKLGETSGTNAVDFSGRGHDGTYTGSPTLGEASLVVGEDTAVDFVEDSYVQLTDHADLEPGSAFTWEFWVKRVDETHDTSSFWSKATGGNLYGEATGALRIGNNSGTVTTSIDTTLDDNERHHVVVTYAGTGAGNTLIYIDGHESHSDGAQINVGLVANATDPRIGAYALDLTEDALSIIDEFATYSSVKSQSWVDDRYALGTPSVTTETGSFTADALIINGADLAYDYFGRTATGALGTSDSLDTWTADTATYNWNIQTSNNGEAYTDSVPEDGYTNTAARLEGTAAGDMRALAKVRFGGDPTTHSSHRAQVNVRATGDSLFSYFAAMFNFDGSIDCDFSGKASEGWRTEGAWGTTADIGTWTDLTTEEWYVECIVFGEDPITYEGRVWKVGTARPSEPDATAQITESEYNISGHAGMYAYNTAPNNMVLYVDLFEVWSYSAPATGTGSFTVDALIINGADLAYDYFGRTSALLTGSTADSGETWDVAGGPADFSVQPANKGEAYTDAMASGDYTQSDGLLPHTPTTDQRVLIKFRWGDDPVEGGINDETIAVNARRIQASDYGWTCEALFGGTDDVWLRFRGNDSGGWVSPFQQTLLTTTWTDMTTEEWWLEFIVYGTGPTYLEGRVWKDGDARPSSPDISDSVTNADMAPAGVGGFWAAANDSEASHIAYVSLFEVWSYNDGLVEGDFTADAIIEVARTGSFNADAIVQSPQGSTFSGEAVVLSSTTDGFGANAVVLATRSGSFDVSAIKYDDVPGTDGAFSTDAVIARTSTGSFVLDAIRFAVGTVGSFDVDAIRLVETQAGVLADAVVFATQGAATTLDAVLVGTQAAAFTVDAVTHASVDATFDADAVVSRVEVGAFGAEAVLQAGASGAYSLEGTILGPVAGSFQVAAFKFDSIPGSDGAFSLDAVFLDLVTDETYVDAVVRSTGAGQFTVEATALRVQNGSTSLDAFVQPFFTLDAFVSGAGAGSFTVDAALKGENSDDFTTDAVLHRVGEGSLFTASAVVLAPSALVLDVDATVLARQSGVSSLDAVKRAEVGGSLAVDGVKRVVQVAGMQADAIRLATLSSDGFTAEAVLLKGATQTFEVAAILYDAIPGTDGAFSLDAVVLGVAADALVADAVVLVGQAQDLTVDALRAEAASGQFTADGIVSATTTEGATLDAVIAGAAVGSFTLDAITIAGATESTSVDAVLIAGAAGSLSLDAWVERTISGSFDVDAVLGKSTDSSFTVEAFVEGVGVAAFSLDAVVFSTEVGELDVFAVVRRLYDAALQADAVVRRGQVDSLTADADIQRTQAATFSLDATTTDTLTGQFTVDGVVQAEQGGQFASDAVVHRVIADSVALDAVIVRTQSGALTADAWLELSVTDAYTADAVLTKVQSGSFGVDSFVAGFGVAAFSADAAIKRTTEASTKADAAIRATGVGAFVLDAAVLAQLSGGLDLDAVKTATIDVSGLTVDGVLLKTTDGSTSADATLLDTQAGSTVLDAVKHVSQEALLVLDGVIAEEGLGAFTADAVVVAGTQYASFSVDSVVIWTQTASLTANAYVEGLGVAAFSADAVVNKEAEASLLVDAVLDILVQAQFQIDATVFAAVQGGLSADAVIRRDQNESVTLDATIGVSHGDVFVVSATIESEQQDAFQTDAFIAVSGQGVFSVDAVVVAVTHEASFTSDALVLGSIIAPLAVDAVVTGSQASAFTVDAGFIAGASGVFTLDAWLESTVTDVYTLDAVVSGTPSDTIAVDAVLSRTSSATFSTDSIVEKTEQSSLTLDANISGARTGGFTTDAALFAGMAGAFTVDAVKRPSFWTLTLDASITGWHYVEIEATFSSGTISWTGTAETIEMTPSASTIAWTPVDTRQASFLVDAVFA
jgi:hypothetical protein